MDAEALEKAKQFFGKQQDVPASSVQREPKVPAPFSTGYTLEKAEVIGTHLFGIAVFTEVDAVTPLAEQASENEVRS